MTILAAIFPCPPPSFQDPLPDQPRKESGCIISQIKAEEARSQEPDAKGSACAHGPYLMNGEVSRATEALQMANTIPRS